MAFMGAFHKFPNEAAIIGRLLAGYGELEYLMAMCLGAALGDEKTAIRVLFRMKSERVTVANSLLSISRTLTLHKYTAAIGNMRHCTNIRNQYAHCNWEYSPRFGLFFVDLQDSARGVEQYKHNWRHVDVPLLNEQEFFFFNTFHWWERIRQGFLNGGKYDPSSSEPERLRQPLLYNPPEEHSPPWLNLEVEDPPFSTPLRDTLSPP